MPSPVVISRMQNRRGTQDQFDALYPPGYDGTGGFGSIVGYDITNFPNVLLSGELALCTDTRKVFMGNINGEYFELQGGMTSGLLLPLVITLPPAASFTVISELTYIVTPFMKIMYDVTDSVSANWNTVGPTFSRNGLLEITAVDYFPPSPPDYPALLTDTGTEINGSLPDEISFEANYDIPQTHIEISYKHDFSGNLTFSTSSIAWFPF